MRASPPRCASSRRTSSRTGAGGSSAWPPRSSTRCSSSSGWAWGSGSLVDKGAGQRARVDARRRLPVVPRPGLLAATVVQVAAAESTYPIMARIKWDRIYDAMLATPMGVVDLVAGQLAWIALRLLQTSVIFLAVMALFGAVESPLAVLAIPAAVLTGHGDLGADLRLGRHARKRLCDEHGAAVRDHADVPVLRHVLPREPAAGGHPSDRVRDAAVARRRPLPLAGPRHRELAAVAPFTSPTSGVVRGSAASPACITFRRRLVL